MPHQASEFTFIPPDRGFPVYLQAKNPEINCSKLSVLTDRVNEYWNAAEITLSFDIDITNAPGNVDYNASSIDGYDNLKYIVTKTPGPASVPAKPMVRENIFQDTRVPPNRLQQNSTLPNLQVSNMRIVYSGTDTRVENGGMFIFEDGLYYSITISKAEQFLLTSDSSVAQHVASQGGGTTSSFNVTWQGKSGSLSLPWYLVAKTDWAFTVNSATMAIEYFTYS